MFYDDNDVGVDEDGEDDFDLDEDPIFYMITLYSGGNFWDIYRNKYSLIDTWKLPCIAMYVYL